MNICISVMDRITLVNTDNLIWLLVHGVLKNKYIKAAEIFILDLIHAITLPIDFNFNNFVVKY